MSTFFSFGGGRQSTAIALLLIHEPEKLAATKLDLPKHIIFADTGAEPKAVISHVQEMEKLLTCAGYQFHWVYKDSGNFVPIDESPNGVPLYFKGEHGQTSMLKRQCTNNYKVQPVQKKIRELLGAGKGQRIKGTHDLWLGISLDEAQRATNNSEKWLNKQYPLIKLAWTATDCVIYAYYHLGYQVPKSSCYFCPFKRPFQWMEMKEKQPEEFERAVAFDEKIRKLEQWGKKKAELYLTSSCTPLDRTLDQPSIPFGIGIDETCGGHCGL